MLSCVHAKPSLLIDLLSLCVTPQSYVFRKDLEFRSLYGVYMLRFAGLILVADLYDSFNGYNIWYVHFRSEWCFSSGWTSVAVVFVF